MRKFITLFLILTSVVTSFGQVAYPEFSHNNNRLLRNKGGYIIDSALSIPTDTSSFSQYSKNGRIVNDGTSFYYFDSSKNSFIPVARKSSVHNTPEYNLNKVQHYVERRTAKSVVPFAAGDTAIVYYIGAILRDDGYQFGLAKGAVNNFLLGYQKAPGEDTFTYYGIGIAQGSGGEPDAGQLWNASFFRLPNRDSGYCLYTAIDNIGNTSIGLAFIHLDSLPGQLTKEAGVTVISKAQIEAAVGYTIADVMAGDVVIHNNEYVTHLSIGDVNGKYTIWAATSSDLRNWDIGVKVRDTSKNFDVISSATTFQADDSMWYMLHDRRVSTVFSGELVWCYSPDPTKPFKDLDGVFMRVKNGDEYYTDFTARLYAARLLKDGANPNKLATIDGLHTVYYSAATPFNGGNHIDRTFENRFKLTELKQDTTVNDYVLKDGGNKLPNPISLGTLYNSGVTDHSVSFLIAGTPIVKFNNAKRTLFGEGQVDWGYTINTPDIGVGDYVIFNNAGGSVTIGDGFTYTVGKTKPAKSIHIGSGAGKNDTTCVGCLKEGRNAGKNNNGTGNIFKGDQVAENNLNGRDNAVVANFGWYGGGDYNSGVGHWAGFFSNASASGNSWVGWEALKNCQGCTYNFVAGMQGGLNIINGTGNIYLGTSQGYGAGDESYMFRVGYAPSPFLLGNMLTGTLLLDGTLTTTENLIIQGELKVDTCPEHADNAAAITAGLEVGDVYRTGDILKIVH